LLIKFGFGNGFQTVDIPNKNLIGILKSNHADSALTEEEEVLRAIHVPIRSLPLSRIVHSGEKVAVITSDLTRPMPTSLVMPAVLDELYRGGVRPEDITLVFALGSHRKQTDAERRKLAGERAWKEIRCADFDASDCVCMGTTSRGTPVELSRTVAEADRRVCLGNIEYHYFAGYSGGMKAILPGVAAWKTIQANHSHMTDPAACAGRMEGNPVRQDLEEAVTRFCPADFILNVILDEHKKIIHAAAGHPVYAHREGCAFLDRIYRAEISHKADIVICSQGGAPKDLNLYQTQKALDNAKHAVKKGGVIILIGSCKEGLGQKVFEQWMVESPTPHDMIEHIQSNFQLGGHKAAAIAMVLENADIYLVSEMEPTFVRRIFLTPFFSAQEALNAAFKKLGENATVLAMPYGGSTLPIVKK
jgi:nickel-dependent lactate racemase